jgi:hypothetical protein
MRAEVAGSALGFLAISRGRGEQDRLRSEPSYWGEIQNFAGGEGEADVAGGEGDDGADGATTCCS